MEGTTFYHFYSAFPLAALYEVARARGRVSAEETRRLVALLRAPLHLADPQGRLPPFGDLGAPKSLHLRLYRHLYEYGAGVMDGASGASGASQGEAAGEPDGAPFGSALALLYSGGFPRNSLAAVAFGPDALPPPRRQPLTSVSLPASGVAVLRAPLPPEPGEGSAERDWMQVWLRSGPHGHGHDHPDKLGFVLHAGGEVIAADPGTAGYGLQEHTRFCRSTLAHNTLLVDEGDQARVQRASLRFHPGPAVPTGSPHPEAGGGWAVGTLGDAYPGVVLERRVALRAPFLLLEDVCQVGGPDGPDGAAEVGLRPRRFGWVLHAYGSLATLPGPEAGGPVFPALPEEGPFAWLSQRRDVVDRGDGAGGLAGAGRAVAAPVGDRGRPAGGDGRLHAGEPHPRPAGDAPPACPGDATSFPGGAGGTPGSPPPGRGALPRDALQRGALRGAGCRPRLIQTERSRSSDPDRKQVRG